MPYRGSRKHVLDLLDSATFVQTLNALTQGSGFSLVPESVCRPGGYIDPRELYLPRFCESFCQGKFNYTPILNWWVPAPWRPPTWDLIATGDLDGRFGMLLVEAKAHEDELERKGKRLLPSATIGSKRNHEQICQCLADASKALNDHCHGVFNLGVRSRYQLANRVAHLWKLASCGIPVVLLYLGFTGDTYFDELLTSSEHWQRAMGGYIQGAVPQRFVEKRINFDDGGSVQFIVRSQTVLEPSI
jgi:hypothetical protein